MIRLKTSRMAYAYLRSTKKVPAWVGSRLKSTPKFHRLRTARRRSAWHRGKVR